MPHTTDPVTSSLMAPLFERGREALRTFIATLPEKDWPLGGPDAARAVSFIITKADFVSHAALCFDHVTNNGALVHVLCETGAICAIFEKRTVKW